MGVLVVAGAGIAAVLLRGGEDEGLSQAAATSTTSTTVSQNPSTSSTTGTTVTSGGSATSGTATVSTSSGAAPWRSAKLARSAAPAPWLEAWGRAKNRRTCALLVPSGPGPNMAGAGATFDPVNGDQGWDVYLRRGPYVIEILGLFNASDSPGRVGDFEKKWPDGSVARYGEDQGAFEAVLVLPDQSCGYRIYDSQGKEHLEFVLDHLRFVQGAP